MSVDRRPNRWVQIDVLLLGSYALVSPAAESLPEGSVVRFVVAIPLMFFVPGYFATVALFPTIGVEPADRAPLVRRTTPLDGLERVALSFGLSVVILPLFALVAWYFGPDGTVVGGSYLGVLSLGLGGVAWLRRVRSPVERRYVPAPIGTLSRALAGTRSRPPLHQVASAVLAVAILASVGMLAVGLGAPQDGEDFTEFLVGTADEEGEFVLSGYPSTINSGDPTEYRLLVSNYEGERRSYTLLIELQRLDGGEVVQREPLDSVEFELANGETEVLERTVRPSMQGDDLRLTFLLYQGDRGVEGDPGQRLHLWVNVTDELRV